MKRFNFLLLCLGLTSMAYAQDRYVAEKSYVTFFSDGVIEDIKADNANVTSILDVAKGEVAFLVNVRDFQFEKKLMQVHFNEKYLESEKYPKSSFQGKITGFNPTISGVQQIKAMGKLFIHGVTKDVVIPGSIEVKDQQILVKSKFIVTLSDYNIQVPQIVWQNVAQQVEVTVDFVYRSL